MGFHVRVDCDQCYKDITYTGNQVDYRIALNSEIKNYYPDLTVVTCLAVAPPIPDLKFCSKPCLKEWVEENL